MLCGGGRSRQRRRSRRRAGPQAEASVRLTLSARLTAHDDAQSVPVTAGRQSQLLDTLDRVVDAVQSAAVEHRLLAGAGGGVTAVRELSRSWEPVVCRDGELRSDDDDQLSACCELAPSLEVAPTSSAALLAYREFRLSVIMFVTYSYFTLAV